MRWKVVATPRFAIWFERLGREERVQLLALFELIEDRGPNLSRPYSDSIKGSLLISNLKELRAQILGRPYRVFYAFDESRNAVLLCGGVKDGSKAKRFYTKMIALAEVAMTEYKRN